MAGGSGGSGSTGGASGSAGSAGPDGALADAAENPDASADGGSGDAPDAGAYDASSDGGYFEDACLNPSGVYGEDTSITSSAVDPDMTLEKFTMLCNQRGGVVELLCHCGGANNCKGMSFDTTTMTLNEHTCKGMNTCAGYSCVIP